MQTKKDKDTRTHTGRQTDNQCNHLNAAHPDTCATGDALMYTQTDIQTDREYGQTYKQTYLKGYD